MHDKPKRCRLSDREWLHYKTECKRGRLFFTVGGGLMGAVNRIYQRALLGWRAGDRPTHVGVIGDERFAYEALPLRGLTRDFCVDRYVRGNRRLVIGELRYPLAPQMIDAGIRAMLRYMRNRRGGYDFLSLLSFGLAQSNGRLICSEVVKIYADEALRYQRGWALEHDRLVLPWEWLDLVDVKFEG